VKWRERRTGTITLWRAKGATECLDEGLAGRDDLFVCWHRHIDRVGGFQDSKDTRDRVSRSIDRREAVRKSE
jgi:hypothetical protein